MYLLPLRRRSLFYEFDQKVIDEICPSSFTDQLVLQFYQAHHYYPGLVVCQFVFGHISIPRSEIGIPLLFISIKSNEDTVVMRKGFIDQALSDAGVDDLRTEDMSADPSAWPSRSVPVCNMTSVPPSLHTKRRKLIATARCIDLYKREFDDVFSIATSSTNCRFFYLIISSDKRIRSVIIPVGSFPSLVFSFPIFLARSVLICHVPACLERWHRMLLLKVHPVHIDRTMAHNTTINALFFLDFHFSILIIQLMRNSKFF